MHANIPQCINILYEMGVYLHINVIIYFSY